MPRLMEVLEHQDPTGQTMAYRVPEAGECEIKWGAQLTVRESQVAVFFRDGRSLDVFGPGRHVLQTQNIPLLTKLLTRIGYGTDSPFRAEVYFLNMKLFPNLRWGTREPILFRDSELHMIRLRAHGTVSIQITEPTLFLNKVVGTQGVYLNSDITEYLRSIIVTRLTNVLGDQLSTVFELPSRFNELSTIARESVRGDLSTLGLKAHDLLINTISPPHEVQQLVDARTGMSAVGDMERFLKFKAALAMEAAASNPGSDAASGAGLGAGVGLGFMLPQMLAGAPRGEAAPHAREDTADPAQRLIRLKDLFDRGVITEAEYEQKRRPLLEEL